MDCVYAKNDFMNYCREAEKLLKMDFGRKQPSKKEITKCAVDMEIMDRNAAMAILQDYISEHGKYIVITQDAPNKLKLKSEDGKEDLLAFDVGTEPERWKITKPKTYLDDFLEKFPEAKLNENFISLICLKDLYNITIDCDAVEDCEHCWNLIMEGE